MVACTSRKTRPNITHILTVSEENSTNGSKGIRFQFLSAAAVKKASASTVAVRRKARKDDKEDKEETKIFPDPVVAIHRVKWNPNVQFKDYLGTGGKSGILFVFPWKT